MISTVQSLKHYQCFQQYKVSRWKVGRGWLISNPQTLLYFPGEKKKYKLFLSFCLVTNSA